MYLPMIDYIGMFEKIAATTHQRISSDKFYRRMDAKAAFKPHEKEFVNWDGTVDVINLRKVNPYSPLPIDQQVDARRLPTARGSLRQPLKFDRPKDITKSQLYKKPRHIRLAEKGYGRFLPVTTRKFGESTNAMYDRIIKKDLGHTPKPGLLNAIKTETKLQWLTNPRFRAEVGGFVGGALAHLPQLFQ